LTPYLWDPHRRASTITKGIVAGGVLVLIVLWAVVAVSVIDAREAAMGQARSVARNLAIAFDDEVQNTLAEIVRGMDFFTKRIRENSGHFDLYEWVRENPLLQPGVEAAISGSPCGACGGGRTGSTSSSRSAHDRWSCS